MNLESKYENRINLKCIKITLQINILLTILSWLANLLIYVFSYYISDSRNVKIFVLLFNNSFVTKICPNV